MVASIVASFIRKVPTASGTRAVQIVHKQGRQVVGVEHIGSAHDDAKIGVLFASLIASLLAAVVLGRRNRRYRAWEQADTDADED